PLVDRLGPHRRRARADGSRGHLLGARRQGGARALGDDPRGRVRIQRPGGHRPDDRDGRARDRGARRVLDGRQRVPGRDERGPRRARSRGPVVARLGAAALLAGIRHAPLPDRTLYPVAMILAAGVVYGAAAVAHGSGFLAVFVAGILVGDAHFKARPAVRSFNSALSDLGELAAFVALGLTIDLAAIADQGLWWRGLVLAALLAFVIRPIVVGPLLAAMSLTWGERGFIVWSGLKGAVPILLASLAVVGGTDYAAELYGIVFVVVLLSVIVQGSLVPTVATLLGVPMEAVPKD